ncbi:type II toxin-antitoxin system RelE/ParE family toxin [Sphingomonas lycopersici]|uniref:Type II toxin-antitoxin system RelE/ParE family toxin n=1 Tax=Sphingomonas lycopersici TaxID=2951807 RepID=A0AA41ZAX9_9SPHN|nr:type II toxin-antitoxin system RelE/ParE family toxin [Sphingomonas lycopersici]MCW6536710.1 type II toxin-antitoxin system RelE/ParE family toxin [Sphingomonas lycopersici]
MDRRLQGSRAGDATGQGRAGRILFRQGDRAIFAFGLAKSARANTSKADLAPLRSAVSAALEWSNEELDRLTASGGLVEIEGGNNDEG